MCLHILYVCLFLEGDIGACTIWAYILNGFYKSLGFPNIYFFILINSAARFWGDHLLIQTHKLASSR